MIVPSSSVTIFLIPTLCMRHRSCLRERTPGTSQHSLDCPDSELTIKCRGVEDRPPGLRPNCLFPKLGMWRVELAWPGQHVPRRTQTLA
eukprot:11229620-Heterocapsa_arctica.AAC.1